MAVPEKARKHALKEIPEYLAQCQSGEYYQNGGNLHFMVKHYIEHGGKFEVLEKRFKLTWYEIYIYLALHLKELVKRIEDGERWPYQYFSLGDIEQYLLDEDRLLLDPDLVAEIGMTDERFNEMAKASQGIEENWRE